ncbi:OmpA family protein [Paeniroseomonas aquatica]|uniref:OmpA family protein n=1 Tax=Paeniroseomonas aquatica TaxID=373043 RepID=A0ABT8AE98_9PROT|nr:OmpA family protein [Paeniroseomonas aquatica]MDN3567674.1 OmpA family protein [Paeniroseomonas aquatica]
MTWGAPVLLALGLALSACATPPAADGPAPTASAGRPAPPQAPKPPKEAQPLDAAVLSLADAVLARAEISRPGPHELVIDPLIDRASGTETATTRAMSRRIASVVRERHPSYRVQPFTLASLESKPLVLLGAITGVVEAGSLTNSTDKAPAAYRIWAVLADLSTGKVVAHETAWVRPDEVDTTPTAFNRDSPTWLDDPAAAAYLRVCAGNPGDAIDAAWLDGLKAEALITQATTAYEAGRYAQAKTLYANAKAAPKGAQLRTLNGQYLTASALGQPQEAERAFGQLVDYGLERKRLAVKFLFRPGVIEFWPDPAISGPYDMWLRQIASRTSADDACLDVSGHASTTGAASWNDRLSLMRAQAIRTRLVGEQPGLGARLKTEGFGASRPLVGTGRDDATDALDRRVEFEPRECRTG